MRPIWLAVVFTLSLTVAPLTIEAQQVGKVPRVGYLIVNPGSRPSQSSPASCSRS